MRRKTGIARPVTTPELLRKALSRAINRPPTHQAHLPRRLHAPTPAEVTVEINEFIGARARQRLPDARVREQRVNATRELIFSPRPTLLPVELVEVNMQGRAQVPDWIHSWRLSLPAPAEGGGEPQDVYISTDYWALGSMTAAAEQACRYYQAIAVRINYIISVQNTLGIYLTDDKKRRVRKRKRDITRNRNVGSIQMGMTHEDYYRLKGSYRGTFTNFDIVEEAHHDGGRVDEWEDSASSHEEDLVDTLLREDGVAGSDESDDEHVISPDDIQQLLAALDAEDQSGTEEASVTVGKSSAPKRTQTHRDHRLEKVKNVFGFSSQNKKKQLKRRHTHNPKARTKGAKARSNSTADAAHHQADVRAIKKRRQYTREDYVDKLLKRFTRAYTPLVKRLSELAAEHGDACTDAVVEGDVTFMHLWNTFETVHEYHPGDALYMHWYTTDTPGANDPFSALHEAYTCTYPEGIDAVYATAVVRAGARARQSPLRTRFAAFYQEVLDYEWGEGMGLTLWYPQITADAMHPSQIPGPPPIEGHGVFWTTYFNVYQLELAARGRPAGICRDRSTQPAASGVAKHVRYQAQQVLTAHLPIACYFRRELAMVHASPGGSYFPRIGDSMVPIDVYEPSEVHLVPDANTEDIMGYTRHLQHIDFWYPRMDESDIITQIIGKCLPYRSHGRNNTSLGRRTLKQKSVYQLFLLRVARMVMYGLYDLERWDATFIESVPAGDKESETDELEECLTPHKHPPYRAYDIGTGYIQTHIHTHTCTAPVTISNTMQESTPPARRPANSGSST